MKRAFVAMGVMALGLGVAFADTNIVDQRQAVMKSFGAEAKTISGMLRGQAPFDLAQAKAAMKTVATGAQKLPPLFPESTKGAAKTEALPTIWENKADFDKIFSNLEKASEHALATVTDEASFKAEMPKILQNCGTCHKTYRKG